MRVHQAGWSRLAIGALATVLVGFVSVPTAAADPIGNPGAQVITQSCDGIGFEFVVRHAGRSDNLPAASHTLGFTSVGRILWTDVEIFADGVLVDSFHLDWHHGKIGNGISEDRLVTCTNVIELPDGMTVLAHNTSVYPPSGVGG